MAKRLLRLPGVLNVLPIGKTMFHERYVKTGRVRGVPLGPRATGYVEDEILEIVDELIRERDAKPPPKPPPKATKPEPRVRTKSTSSGK